MFSSLCRKSTANYVTKLHSFYKSLGRDVKQKYFMGSKHICVVKSVRECSQRAEVDSLHVNTNVKNNVILYKNENNRYFRTFKVFSYGWAFFASILSYYTYDPKFISTFSKNISWVEYVKENGLNLIYFCYALLVGPSALLLLYVVNKKFVKYMILHKGGRDVSIITYHLLKNEDVLKFPVNKVTAIMSRAKMGSYLPVKVKGRFLYYLLDADGKFLNVELFDHTVGTKKS